MAGEKNVKRKFVTQRLHDLRLGTYDYEKDVLIEMKEKLNGENDLKYTGNL